MSFYFDSPQWSWKATDEINDYGAIEGFVQVNPEGHAAVDVKLAVPAEFFKWYRDVFTEEFRREHRYGHFYMDEVDKRWNFGLLVMNGDREVEIDLWYYTRSNLPKWVRY